MTTTTIHLDSATRQQIEKLVKVTGEPEEKVLGQVVKVGLKNYPVSTPNRGAKALLELAELAEKHPSDAPKDLSQNLDHYLWDE